MTATELIERARDGDHAAFAVLMRAHEGRVRAVCRRFASDPDDALDLALEAFVAAYLKLDQLRDPASFGPWLHGLTANLCRSWYRRQRPASVPLPAAPEAPEAAESLDDRVAAGMAQLRPAHRRVLELHYHEGRSYQEIAETLAVPIGTVMSRLHRARNALRDIVGMTEENDMEARSELAQRFRTEIELMAALKAEAEAAAGVERVKVHSEPMVRLRRVIAHHPPRLVDLLRVSDSDAHLEHLAWAVRPTMQAAMPVMASCALSEDDVLSERAVRMAEHWIVRPWYGLRGLDLFLDTLIASPAAADRKAGVLMRLIGTLQATGPVEGGHHLMEEVTRVLLGYPDAAFAALWEALWRLDEATLVEQGVRRAIAHLVEPLSDALIEAARSGDAGRAARLLRELTLVPVEPWESVFGEAVPPPARLHPVLVELAARPDPVVAMRSRLACVRFRIPGIVPGLRGALASDDAEVRAEAIKALAAVAGEAAVPDLLAHLEDPAPRVRAEAVTALGQTGATSARERILERLEGDEDAAVREAAVRAYGKVASKAERQACLARITASGDKRLIRAAARALYEGTGPRKRTELEKQRIQRIRGDARPRRHIDPVAALRALPEIRAYGEEELTRIVAGVCGDFSTTRRQMVMEGRHALMRREKGVYTFTEIGEAVWRVGRFSDEAKRRLLARGER